MQLAGRRVPQRLKPVLVHELYRHGCKPCLPGVIVTQNHEVLRANYQRTPMVMGRTSVVMLLCLPWMKRNSA